MSRPVSTYGSVSEVAEFGQSEITNQMIRAYSVSVLEYKSAWHVIKICSVHEYVQCAHVFTTTLDTC